MRLGFLPCLASSGATTLAFAAATRIVERGGSVVLLDGDPSAELSTLLRRKPARPLQDLLAWGGEGSPPPALQLAPRFSLVPMQQGRFSGGGVPPRSSLRAALDAHRGASFLFVDLAPVGQPITSELLPLLDEVLLVLPAHGAGVRALPAALRFLLGFAPKERPRIGAVAVTQGRAGGPSGQAPREVRAALGRQVSVLEIPWNESIEVASFRGEPPTYEACSAGLEPWLSGLLQRADATPAPAPLPTHHAT